MRKQYSGAVFIAGALVGAAFALPPGHKPRMVFDPARHDDPAVPIDVVEQRRGKRAVRRAEARRRNKEARRGA